MKPFLSGGAAAAYLAISILVVACGATKIHEEHVLQTRQPHGEIAYYRLTIYAQAKLAKTDYKAGLYDAEALDALTSGVLVDDAQSVDRTLQRLRRENVAKIAEDFYEKVRTGKPIDIRLAQARLSYVLESPWDLAKNWDGKPAKPRRKYAIIFSALASVVEKAIADFAEESKTVSTVLSAVSGFKREQLLRVTAQSEALDATMARVRAVQQGLDSQDENNPDPQVIRTLLENIASIQVR